MGSVLSGGARRGGPLLLVGGGSGIVPLMSMLRHRLAAGSDVPAVLIYSARTLDEVIYRDELAGMAANDPRFRLIVALTRGHPPGWEGPTRRVDAGMLADAIGANGTPAYVYCCGSDGFVENAANLIVAAGVDPGVVRTERFGPPGT